MHTNTLMSLVDQAGQLEKALIASNGEVTPEIEALLKVTDIKLPEKVDNYALIIDRMEHASNFYNQQAEFFARLARAADRVQDYCKGNIKSAMEGMMLEEISGVHTKFKLVRAGNPSLIIDDENLIDASYKTIEQITKIDKEAMKEDLKLEVPVEGAHLEYKVSLRRFANSPSGKSEPKKKAEKTKAAKAPARGAQVEAEIQ